MRLRNKRTVEIYFILYLAAIIFLLPDKELTEDSNENLTGNQFNIQPLKTTLYCRYYIDSAGPHILEIDSVNTIFYSGNSSNIKFEYEIEDLTIKQKQKIFEESNYFIFNKKKSKNELEFIWNPNLLPNANKTFVVNVLAFETDLDEDINESFLSQTQFSLILVDVSQEMIDFGLDSATYIAQAPVSNIIDTRFQTNIVDFDPSKINIETAEIGVKEIAYKTWKNKIYIWGANPELHLKKKPDVRVFLEPEDNNGSAKIETISQNYILVSGKTPAFGSMKVEVEMVFEFDNKKRTIDFYVSPRHIERPEYPKIMYPENEYTLYPNLPTLVNQEVLALIKEGNKVLRRSEQGQSIKITPTQNQIDKVFTLERIIDNDVYDSYEISIQDYPNPIIYDMQRISDTEIKIVTRSYGYYNGERNLVELSVSGNVKVRELRGQIKENDISFLQVFQCNPKDIDNKFEFSVTAVDKRKKKSSKKKYPN